MSDHAPRALDETYGGQAVIEGVMMRDRNAMCIAVRTPGGTIALKHSQLGAARRLPFFKLPIIRGMLALYDSVKLGVDALLWSAEAAGEPEEQLAGWQVALTMTLSMAIAVGLFMLLPTLIVSPLRWMLSLGEAQPSYLATVGLNVVEGLVRLGILVAYVTLIARMPDVARVLQYHGAEHRIIHAVEAGGDLTVEAARPFAVIHPRCGTSFLLYVVMVSVLIFSFFGWPGIVQRIVIRLSLLPFVAGISYEWVRLAGKSKSPFVKALCLPGMWLQRLTTRQPDDGQVEVAIAALRGLRGERLVEEGQM